MPNRDILPTQLLFLDSLTSFPSPSARGLSVKFSRWTQIVLHPSLKSLKTLQVRILDIYVPNQNEMDISILLCLVLPRQTCSFPKKLRESTDDNKILCICSPTKTWFGFAIDVIFEAMLILEPTISTCDLLYFYHKPPPRSFHRLIRF